MEAGPVARRVQLARVRDVLGADRWERRELPDEAVWWAAPYR